MSDDVFNVKAQSSEFKLHEEDEWYEGVVRGPEYEADGKYGPQFRFTLDLTPDGAGEDEKDEVPYWTPTKITPRNKLGKFIKTLTGEDIDTDTVYDVRELAGTPIKVMFEHKQGVDEDGNSVTRDKPLRIKARAS